MSAAGLLARPHEPGGPPRRAAEAPRTRDGDRVTAFECTIAVEDVAATAAAIETQGGQFTMQPYDIEHVGTLVMFKDTEVTTVSALQYLPGIC